MLSPRWRKVARDLLSNKTRTLLVVMSIAVGVFAVGVIVSTQLLLSQDLTARYAATNPADAVLMMSNFDNDVVDTVARMPGVHTAEGRRTVSLRVKVGPNEWRTLSLDAIDDFNKQKLSRVDPVSGAWPPPDKTMLVERASLGLINAQVGDRVTVELADGKTREIKISGIAHDMNKAPAAFTGSPYGYVNLNTVEWLGFPKTYDQLRVTFNGHMTDREQVEVAAEEIRKKVEKGDQKVHFIWVPTPGKHPADDAVQPLLLILAVLGGLSLFLSGFLVVNTMSALLMQQQRQIGIMKAVGAQAGQITSLYLGMVLIFGALALFVAVPLGALGAWALTGYMASLINFDMMGLRIPLPSLLLQIAVGLLVPLIASLLPIFSGVRVSVREALSSYGVGSGRFGTHLVDRIMERVRGFSRPTLISLRNTFRRKARLTLTMFTLVLAGAVFIGVLSVHASLLNTLDAFFNYWHYDVAINFSRPYRTDQVTAEALSVPGVVDAETWAAAQGGRKRSDDTEGRAMTLLGVPPTTQLLQPKILEGRWLLPEDENAIVINTAVREPDMEPDIKLGDDVTFKIDGRDETFKVVGVARTMLTGPLLYVHRDYLEKVTNSVGRAGSVQVITERSDRAFQTQTAEALKNHFKDQGINVSGTQAIGDLRQQIEYQFNLLVVFLTIMATLIAVVGGLGLMGTMSINVIERTREIGVMRAIGASDGSVMRIFLTEGIFIGLLSWVQAAIFAIPISRLLSAMVGQAFLRSPLEYVFSWQGAFLWLGIVLVLASLASLLPSWHAARLTVRDVLAYE